MTDSIPTSVVEIRALRKQLQHEEDAVSYVRRLAQGRVDIVLDEQRRRESGTDAAPVGTLAERLADVFGQQHGGGSARPPRETEVPTDHPLVQQLDQICDEYQFASLDTLSDKSLSELLDALQMYEKTCSGLRHDLFQRIDALTTELVKRLKSDGTSGVVGQ